MKLVKTLFATTLVFTAFSTFAASPKEEPKTQENEPTLISSSQENPVNSENTSAASPTTTQPSTEIAVEETPVSPSTAQPAQ